MRTMIIALLTLFVVNAAAVDERYVRTQGPMKRTIEVVQTGDGPLPCEVRYSRAGLEPEVLWSAGNTEGYCTDMASEFVNKQERLFEFECARQREGSKS